VTRSPALKVSAVKRELKGAREKQAEERAERSQERALAERTDPRPLRPAPLPDAERLPEMVALNAILSKSTAKMPRRIVSLLAPGGPPGAMTMSDNLILPDILIHRHPRRFPRFVLAKSAVVAYAAAWV
jgi:hypothetical protein